MTSTDVGYDVFSAVIFLLFLIFCILLYIAYLITNFRGVIGNSEKIIERHSIDTEHDESDIVSSEIENDEQRREKVIRDINLDEKWNKNKKIEAKTNGVGTEKIVDGKQSLDAVEKLRKMHEIDKD